MRFPSITSLLFLMALLLHGGCANYQLGSQLPADIRSVYVPTVRNQTDEPLLENETTKAVMDQLQRDGSLKIVSEELADAVLYVTITDYTLEPLSFSSENRLRPDEYRLRLGAGVELVRRDNGKVLARNNSLQGRNDFTFSGDLTTGKQNGLPGAAEDLARYIVAAITEAWPE